jgi:tRNA-dihydrouridine synthase B
MMHIGTLKLKNRIFLAPMHEVNDIAFRILCKKAGASLVYTGLINPRTKEKLQLQDKPALQFACNSTKGLKEFIKKYNKKISMYDFNLGCPSKHASSSKIGSFMTNNTKKIEEILREIKKYTKKPLTIKIRKMPNQQTRAIIKLANRYCNAIAVHPRTQEQGYSGKCDINYARQIKKLTKNKIPIIYSGDIKTKEQAQQLLGEFDFIMIGRASIGNPGIFSQLLNKKSKKITFQDYYKLIKKEKYKLEFNQLKFQALNFTRGFEGASKLRQEISKAKTEKELKEILNLR